MTDIMIVGEFWKGEEAKAGKSFEGPGGRLLYTLLSQVGIAKSECHLTDVFKIPTHDIKDLVGPREGGIKGMPALIKGKYVRKDLTEHLQNLYQEINNVNPNLIIAMGSTATWALMGTPGIKAIRGAPTGTTSPATLATGVELSRVFKVIPTYHPTQMIKEWKIKPVLLSDLDKARRHSTTPELVRPERFIWIEPTLEDLEEYERTFINPASMLSIDIETKGDLITCIGFAPSRETAIVVPFFKEGAPGNCYWADQADELKAWEYVRRWCETKRSVFQNGLYDIHHLWRSYGIQCKGASEDTMLLHHALQPEMQKGLGFMATLYTDEASWKFMSKVDTLKKED